MKPSIPHMLGLLVAFAVVVACTPNVFAQSTPAQQQPDDPPSANERALFDRIAQLEAEVAVLQRNQGEDYLTERRAEEIRALVHDVLADADTRASLAQSGLNAGYDKYFFVASADGDYRLNLTGTIQTKFAYNSQDSSPDDDDRWGFENRRTTLRMFGHVVDPSWQYTVHGNFASGDFKLFDAFIRKDLGEGWSILAGKSKLPFDREQLMSYNTSTAVERSLSAGTFGVGRAEGFQAAYQAEWFKIAMAVSDGLGTIVGTSAPAVAYDTEYAFTGRAEFLVAGQFSQFGAFTAWPENETGVLLGAAIHWQDDEYGTDDVETGILRWVLDATMQFRPVSVYLAVHGNHTDPNDDTRSLDQYGVVAQVGWLLPGEDWEVFGRYEWADPDSGSGGDDEDLSVATVGVVRYFSRNKIKWTTDLGYGLDPVSAEFADGGKNWREDSSGEDGQIVIRTQLQLVF